MSEGMPEAPVLAALKEQVGTIMSREPYVPPRITESLQWEEADSPPRYAGTTDNPVQYAAVMDRAGTALGYV
ncbi:hypothetical protein ACIGPN_24255 [Streptomyces afghaniensis]